ncbi:MAG: hydantoinase/oxoprolinase family protein [Betaproteobacteria bacterium]|nr:MAG: hydantoinase/oxoprolinase family protein [Betaproteobacteria bacterium]
MPLKNTGWVVGLDIGGTFTDVMMVDTRSGRSARYKALTTPADPSIGALEALEGVLREAGVRPDEVAVLLHATTLVSNALIERKGARTSLVTTRGFKDVIDIAREKKFDIYDLLLDKPAPLVGRDCRIEAPERIAADGSVLEPLTEKAVDAVIAALKSSGAQAVAVCLLHSYMNPAHERALRERIRAAVPEASVCISSDILPEMREFERATTAVANAYVQPLTSGYIDRFAAGVRTMGLACPLFIMLSEGAIAAPELVKRMPIRICESGPAAGAVTSAAVAQQLREPRILSFDMGGTTAKTCVVHDGEPTVTTEFEVARIYRFKKGSGLPLRMPVVDLIEIGAGGGSLVDVDGLGLLKVGPESAAADPGPACYGRGGERATVTDADLALGYLGAESFLGGRMRLDVEAALKALAEHVAKPLRLSVDQAALGVYEVVNENMANAARVQAVERGHDPSGHVLVAFGGAGPVHAWGVAQKLGVEKIVVPPSPGVGSAFGLLLAPRALNLARTYIGTLEALDWKRVQRAYDEMAEEALAALMQAGVNRREARFTRRADMRYLGQRKEITVELSGARFDAGRMKALRESFERQYEKIYHRRHDAHPVEVLCWRLAATGPRTMRLPSSKSKAQGTPKTRARRSRLMLFPGWSKYRMCPVYSRYELQPRAVLQGPAVVEEDESATIVGPGGRLNMDGFGNLIIAVPDGRRFG